MCYKKIYKGSSFPVRQSDFLKVATVLSIFVFKLSSLLLISVILHSFASAISPTSYYLSTHTCTHNHLHLFTNSYIYSHLHTHNHPLTPIHTSHSYSSKHTFTHIHTHTTLNNSYPFTHSHPSLHLHHTYPFLYPCTHICSLILMYNPHSFTHIHLHTHIHTLTLSFTHS